MATNMTWNNCFSDKRFGAEESSSETRTQYERDWDRIIFSSPFRRLQNKTQVFPLPDEVFVHNRLTHSLEVASVGRSLGKIVGEYIAKHKEVKNDKKAHRFYRNNLKNVISAACLAHDLGNPAFGHSGEEAISRYFVKRDTDQPEDKEFKKQFSNEEWKDLTTFEGNANALRILTMEKNGVHKGGFQLTYSTLGSIFKYPCESIASQNKDGPKHRKKYGFFKIDQNTFSKIATELNMIPEDVESGIVYKRHPFVYLVEAADDICYNIIDFEDAHRLGILTFDKLKKHFLKIIEQNDDEDISWIKRQVSQYNKDYNEAASYLRAKAINTLTVKCSKVYINNLDKIIKCEYESSLLSDIPNIKKPIENIEKLSKQRIYNHKNVVKVELAGFRIMSGLVEDFVTAALKPEAKRSREENKIMELLPNQFKFGESSTPYFKVMHVLDFISGMTDLYALKLYRNMRGIEI